MMRTFELEGKATLLYLRARDRRDVGAGPAEDGVHGQGRQGGRRRRRRRHCKAEGAERISVSFLELCPGFKH